MNWHSFKHPPQPGEIPVALIAIKNQDGFFLKASIYRYQDGKWHSEATGQEMQIKPELNYFWLDENEVLAPLEESHQPCAPLQFISSTASSHKE